METNTRYQYEDNPYPRRQRSKSCNPQICFAYLLSVMASILIVGGVYLSYIRWDKMWFILSILGIILILIGSCFYYSGNVGPKHTIEEHIYENTPRRRRRYRNRGLSTDQLMPSAPPLSQSRSVSQFSLNMIPQYFSPNESEGIPSNPTNTPPVSPLKTFSQIFSVNGQSYLILPISGEPLPASNSFPLQNLVLKVSDNELQTSKNMQTCNDMSSESESKKISREEQSSQTEDFLKEIRKANNCYRDVQMQTLERAQLEQTSNEVTNIPTGNTQLIGRSESTSDSNLNQFNCESGVEIDANAGPSRPSHIDSAESQAYSLQSYESNCSSAVTETHTLNLDSETANSLSLIDFNDENSAGTSSQFNCTTSNNFYIQTEQNFTQNLFNSSINETSIRAEDYVESDCFNSFSNENVNEVDFNDNLSTPPPSYEEVVDDSDEETQIVVNYGTL